MSDVRQHQFATTGHARLHVEVDRGSVTVEAVEDLGEIQVEVVGPDAEKVDVTRDGDDVTVVVPRAGGFLSRDSAIDVTARVPAGSDLAIQTGSADLRVSGSCGTALARSGSGEVHLDHQRGETRVETGSGDVRIGTVEGDLTLKSGSGSVSLGRAAADLWVSTGSGDVDLRRTEGASRVKTGTGDLHVHELDGDLAVTTGSGDVLVDRAGPVRVDLTGASTDLRLGVPADLPVWTDLTSITGDIRSTLPSRGEPADGQAYLELHVATVSGDVALVPA